MQVVFLEILATLKTPLQISMEAIMELIKMLLSLLKII
jgi:hypothetical protein